MVNELELIERELCCDTLRASAAGMNMTVALTDSQIVMGRVGLCGQPELLRYPIKTLTATYFLRDARGDLLALEFGAAHSHVVLFPASAQRQAEDLVNLLECPIKKVQLFFNPDLPRTPRYAVAA